MGMDVYGKKPTAKVGEYFRASVWGWHPLWEYVTYVAPDLASKVTYGHSNDGDGLDAANSKALAVVLRNSVRSGAAAGYVKERDEMIANLPKKDCEHCNGTGTRTDHIGKDGDWENKPPNRDAGVCVRCGLETCDCRGWCNACGGRGWCRPWAASYSLEVETISEFANFLDDSGGFEIW